LGRSENENPFTGQHLDLANPNFAEVGSGPHNLIPTTITPRVGTHAQEVDQYSISEFRLNQLRRDPHILGWFAHLRSHTPPLAQAVYVCRLLFLRSVLEELARTVQLPDLACLIRREDLPRIPQRLPRPLTAEQDRLLQEELLRRNDLPANVCFCYFAIPVCASVSALTFPMIAFTMSLRTGGRFTCLSAS
jgi:hypothetical protein